ncbi:MAG: DUF2207 domain-containing protein, partial [Coriobacteriales bacterium]
MRENISSTSTDGVTQRKLPAIVLMLMAAFMLAFAFSAARPQEAYAKSYSCPQVSIEATVETDGSLSVSETRTFSFDGSFSAVWWVYDKLPNSDAEVVTDSVSITQAGTTTELSPVDFQTTWRSYGGPDNSAYSYDEEETTLYVFFSASDEEISITTNYRITNMVQVYKDTAELYWAFIGSDWGVNSDNVSVTLTLPAPNGTAITPGETVRGWAHGPLNGYIDVGTDGVITLTVPSVSSGEYAEVRTTFPTEWLTDLPESSGNQHQDQEMLNQILQEEKSYSDQSNTFRAITWLLFAGEIALIIWALVMFFKYGKEHKPNFKEKYWRDVPAEDVHPTLIGRLWRSNKNSPKDFTATLMHLCNIGVLRIDAGNYPNKRGKIINDYYITLLDGYEDKIKDSPIDKAAIKFMFDYVGSKRNSVWFGSLKEKEKLSPEAFLKSYESFQKCVDKNFDKLKFYEKKGTKYKIITYFIAIAIIFVGIVYL